MVDVDVMSNLYSEVKENRPWGQKRKRYNT